MLLNTACVSGTEAGAAIELLTGDNADTWIEFVNMWNRGKDLEVCQLEHITVSIWRLNFAPTKPVNSE